jgi:ribosomal protein S14
MSYTQTERDTWEHHRAERNALRAEFRKTWTPPFPEPADPESEESTVWSHIEDAAFDCWTLRRAGTVAAATAPYWVGHIEDLWPTNINDSNGVLEREPTAASVTLPFLMEGGEFSLTFQSEKYQDDHFGIKTRILGAKHRRVKSEHGICFGEVKSDCGEMNYDVVILPNGTPQEVADRVAAAYSKIVQLDMPTDYPAIAPLRESCMVCGRPFTDAVSRVIGLGRVCFRRLGLPHGSEAANRIIQRRRELLGEAA